jgi:hypothetical protein
MGTLTDDQLRALRFLARRPGGCTEATLLEQGFTVGQLGHGALRRRRPDPRHGEQAMAHQLGGKVGRHPNCL